MSVPVIYDIALDALRPVTQADVDRLMRLGAEWADFRTRMRQFLDETHARLTAPLNAPPDANDGGKSR